MFGRIPHLRHAHHGEHPNSLRRQIGISILVAALLALIALLLIPPKARGNFVYWSSGGASSTIGRAKINGVGANSSFIGGLSDVRGVAVDSKFIYWTQGPGGGNTIGRANLNGSGVNPNFIASGLLNPTGIAVTASGIYWSGDVSMSESAIARANLDGSGAVSNFIPTPGSSCGLAADASFVYYFGTILHIGRATLDGGTVDPSFVAIPEPFCGLAVDPSFLYWGSDSGNTVGRVPVGGGTPDGGFVPAGTTGGGPSGVAVNSQYVFWGNHDIGAIGRANINGSSPNAALIPGAGTTGPPSPLNPSQLAAAPSNKVTINSVTRKKKKGTAIINAKVPGPGQVTLANAGSEDVNATAATVKQQGLTITAASSFKLAVKPKGKTAKKLKKQVKKKGKGKVKVRVFVAFVPAGVAGVPNSEPVKITLVKQRKKK